MRQRGGWNTKYRGLSREGGKTKNIKEKVIIIMRRQRREWVGVVQSVRGELALFQRCSFSSSDT